MIDKQKNSKSIEDKIVHSSKLMIDKQKNNKIYRGQKCTQL